MFSSLRRKLFNIYSHSPRPVKSLAYLGMRHLPPSLVYGTLFVQTLKAIRKTELTSQDELNFLQAGEIERLLIHAFKTVPHYRQDLLGKGVDEELIRRNPFEALQSMSFIEKRSIMAEPERFMSTVSRMVAKDYGSTGGTYGEPLYFYIDSTRSSKEWAYFADLWGRVGFSLDSRRATFRGARIEGNGRLWEDDFITLERKFSSFEMADDYLERIWPALHEYRPSFIYAYPSTALTLCRFVESTGKQLPQGVKAILIGSENIYDGQREYLERVSRKRVFAWYGHSEKLALAGECEWTSDYHAYPQYGYVEFLNAEDRPAQPGEFAEIVATGFMNTVMPFIRYRTGDYCTYLGDHCSKCGRFYPIFRDVRGRWTQEVLFGVKGNAICMSAVNVHSRVLQHVFRFQFYQDEPGKAVLRLVPRQGFSERDRQSLEKEFNDKLNPNVRVTAIIVDEIPLTERGKFRFIDQRIRAGEG